MIFQALLTGICTLVFLHSFLTGMDPVPTKPKDPNAFYGKLFIDQTEYLKNDQYVSHTNEHKSAIAYIVQKHRTEYPYAQAFKRVPLGTPFVHVKIILDNYTRKAIFTILPAQKLINCTDGSKLDIFSDICRFHLICTKNETFSIDEKYFPQDKKRGNTFERQFLSSMNQFYEIPAYCPLESTKRELISHQVLKEVQSLHERLTLSATSIGFSWIVSYTHGPKGCSSAQQLVDLATNIKTKNDQYNPFKFVTRREYGSKPQPKYNRLIDLNFILTTCLREMEYEDKVREKILNECLDELLVVPKLLARICINQLVIRTLIKLISQKNNL